MYYYLIADKGDKKYLHHEIGEEDKDRFPGLIYTSEEHYMEFITWEGQPRLRVDGDKIVVDPLPKTTKQIADETEQKTLEAAYPIHELRKVVHDLKARVEALERK